MAFNYKPVSRWTKRRRLQGDFEKVSRAIENAISDSDDNDDDYCNKQQCVYTERRFPEPSPCAVVDVTEGCDDTTSVWNTANMCDAGEITDTDYVDTDRSGTSDLSDTDESVITDLQEWAAKHNVSHVAIGDLLNIFKKRYPELPKDARTIMQTCRSVEVRNVAGGSYHHFGLIDSLKVIIDKFDICSSIIRLEVNIDGLPLCRSSSAQFWPILGLVTNLTVKEPFVIGLFYGSSKPSHAAEYLAQFVHEYAVIEHDGVCHRGKRYEVLLSAVVCDMPARTFVKNVKGHTGYHGCDKCVQEGLYIANRMTFPETTAVSRTDESFASQSDTFHHLGPSPFSSLSVGMISNFPIDYMHLVCLGVVRKLVNLWMRGPLRTRIGGRLTEHISAKLLDVRSYVPREFARKPRSLCELDRWKATELRQFLLYTGPVCLKGVIPDAVYDNFMLLSAGVYIVLSPEHCITLNDQAQRVLVNFVQHFGELYGQEFLSYNVHALVHLADEAKLHGALDNVSCFVFENYLGKIKKLLRKPDTPLQQVVKRLSEMSMKSAVTESNAFQKPHESGPVPKDLSNCHQFREFHHSGFTVSLTANDNCVLIDGKPALVRNILRDQSSNGFVVYQQFSCLSSFYTYPFPSDCMDIFCVSGSMQNIAVAPVTQITKKCCCLSDGLQHIVVPLLH